jgi:hypothetical protein
MKCTQADETPSAPDQWQILMDWWWFDLTPAIAHCK